MRSDGVNRVHLLKCESVLCLNQSSLCGMQVISAFPSLVSRRQVFFNPLNELHADFCHTVPSQSVLGKFHIHRHLDLNHIHKDCFKKNKKEDRLLSSFVHFPLLKLWSEVVSHHGHECSSGFMSTASFTLS